MKAAKKIVLASMVMAMFALASAPAAALNTYWTAGTGSWHDPTNWDYGIPDSGDDAYIDNGGTAQIFADAESDWLIAGRYNAGVIEQFDGTNTVGELLSLGYWSGSSGTYNLSGTGGLSAVSECIGFTGTGEFNQDGGTNTVTHYLYLGYVSGGTYNMSAGELSASFEEHIGCEGTGVFNQTGGTHTVNYLHLGYDSSGNGTYNLGGTGGLSAVSEYIGFEGTGEFNQDGGTHTVTNCLRLGYGSGSSGTYNLSAGELSAVSEYIGFYKGAGEFNQTSGTHTVDGYLYIGYSAGSSGEYNFYGGSLEMGDLDINGGWLDIDIDGIDFFRVAGDKVGLLDGYITENKIFDGTLYPDNYLYAIYDSENDWTTLGIGVIPEPGTLLLLAPALLGIAGVLRRRIGNH